MMIIPDHHSQNEELHVGVSSRIYNLWPYIHNILNPEGLWSPGLIVSTLNKSHNKFQKSFKNATSGIPV